MTKTFLPSTRIVSITGPHDAGQSNIIQLILDEFGPEKIERIESLDEITCGNAHKILILRIGTPEANVMSQTVRRDGGRAVSVYIGASQEERINRIKKENPLFGEGTVNLLLKRGSSPDNPQRLPKNFLVIKNPNKTNDKIAAEQIIKAIRNEFISVAEFEEELSVKSSMKFSSPCCG